jgi:hypothetical protein
MATISRYATRSIRRGPMMLPGAETGCHNTDEACVNDGHRKRTRLRKPGPCTCVTVERIFNSIAELSRPCALH